MFQLLLEKSGNPSILTSKVIPLVDAFSLELQFTLVAKQTTAKDAKLEQSSFTSANDVKLREKFSHYRE